MYYKKTKLKLLNQPGNDPLEYLSIQQIDALRMFGLGRTKYVLMPAVDRLAWLQESGLVHQDMNPTLRGRSLAITYRAMKREHEINYWGLTDNHRDVITKRFRRSSSCRLSDNEALDRLCELQWLKHLEKQNFRVSSCSGPIPDYRNQKELDGLVDRFIQMEISDGLSTKYIDPAIVDLRVYEELGLIENKGGRVCMTADGNRARNSYRKFVDESQSLILLEAKNNKERRNNYDCFRSASRLAGVWPVQATEEFINRLCVKHFAAFRLLMSSDKVKGEKMQGINSVNIERKDSQKFVCEEFFSIAGKLSQIVASRVSQGSCLGILPYHLSEKIDPCGQHLYGKYTHVTVSQQDERLPIGTVPLNNVVPITSVIPKDKK